MSDSSPILGLPFLQPSQAQKDVTVNDSLTKLDVIVQLSLEAADAVTPPVTPQEGQVFGVGAAPTGEWAAAPRSLATWFNGAWLFVAPQIGWRAWDKIESNLKIWDGNRWSAEAANGAEQSVTRLGVSTTADGTNRLAVESPATLLTHAGSDHQLKINKATDSDTASLLFQSGFTGHAEMGLAGSTDFAIKVSSDGANWTDAITFEAATGRAGGAAVQMGPLDSGAGKLLTVGAFGLGSDCADLGLNDLDTLSVSGFWSQSNPVRGQVARNYPSDNFTGTLLSMGDASAGQSTQMATSEATQETYLRTTTAPDEWTNWRNVVVLGGEGGRSFTDRASLVAYIANPPVQHAEGDKFSDGRVDYVYHSGAEAIPDLPNLLPLASITPLHWGAVADGAADDGFAVEAAWLYWRTLENPARRQNPESEQQDFYFPTGHYRSSEFLELEIEGTGATIYGDGPVSQLEGIGILLRAAWEFEIRDLRFRGSGDYGLRLIEFARDGSITGIYIRDRDVGIELNEAATVRFTLQEVFKCGIGLLVLKNSGCEFVSCQFSGCTQFNVDVRAGGQLKMTNINCIAAGAGLADPVGSANMRLYGNDVRSVVENYFTKVSLSEAVPGGRQYPISTIRDNGFGKVRITTLVPHEMFPGFNDLRIKGTLNYEDTRNDYAVLDVISPTVFDADIDFIEDEEYFGNEDGAQGTLWLRGWDLLVEAQSAARQVNDQFFTGGNINYTKIDAGFNLNFTGTRLKEQVWIGDTFDDINRLFFVRNGRGRSSSATSDIPVTGPGATKGWGEVGFFDDTADWPANGGEKVSLRMPNTAAGLGANNMVASLNEMSIYADQAKTSIGGKEVVIDTSAAGGALKLTMPEDGIVESLNTPKAWGRVQWNEGVPTLLEGYNVASLTNDTSSEMGRVAVNFENPFVSDNAPMPLASAIMSRDDGVTVQVGLIQAHRVKFETKRNGSDYEGEFFFVVYGLLA